MQQYITDFIEMLTKPVENNAMGWAVLVIMWFCSIGMVAVIILGILEAINSWFRPVMDGVGRINEMEFEAAHYSTVYVYNSTTKTSMPHTVWHPDTWKLVIEIDDSQDTYYLSQEEYVKYKIGEQVNVKYTTGRLWKSVKIKDVMTY